MVMAKNPPIINRTTLITMPTTKLIAACSDNVDCVRLIVSGRTCVNSQTTTPATTAKINILMDRSRNLPNLAIADGADDATAFTAMSSGSPKLNGAFGISGSSKLGPRTMLPPILAPSSRFTSPFNTLTSPFTTEESRRSISPFQVVRLPPILPSIRISPEKVDALP